MNPICQLLRHASTPVLQAKTWVKQNPVKATISLGIVGSAGWDCYQMNRIQTDNQKMIVARLTTVKSEIESQGKVAFAIHGSRLNAQTFQYNPDQACFFFELPHDMSPEKLTRITAASLSYTLGVGDVFVIACKPEDVDKIKKWVRTNSYDQSYISGVGVPKTNTQPEIIFVPLGLKTHRMGPVSSLFHLSIGHSATLSQLSDSERGVF